jgi:hypothetical protein
MDRSSYPALHPLRIAAATLLPTALAGCIGGAAEPAGPCIHEFRDAVVHVDAVVAADSVTAVDSVAITRAIVNGVPMALAWIPLDLGTNAVLRNDTLFCHVPFSFGNMKGLWQVTVSAPNHPTQLVEFEARYAVSKRDCPSYNDGGSHVVWHLTGGTQTVAANGVRR